MVPFDNRFAKERLNAVAKKHEVNPTILQNVIWGNTQGWSQNQIANTYNYNPNTVSRYNRIIRKEMTPEEVRDLIVVIALILGAAYLLDQLFKK